MHPVVSAFGEPTGQGWPQIADLLIAFGLSAVIGLEREVRGKSAGLRTQTIVGTAAALIMLVSKYGFTDVLGHGVSLDASRVAAQIVSGVGFLGAGLIITRHGSIRGLTTAAAVWETAAIGMAAGAGLPILAAAVTGLHYVVVIGFTAVTSRLPTMHRGTVRLRVGYLDRRGALRTMLRTCAERGWTVLNVAVEDRSASEGVGELLDDREGSDEMVSVVLSLSGPDVTSAAAGLAATDNVVSVERTDDEQE